MSVSDETTEQENPDQEGTDQEDSEPETTDQEDSEQEDSEPESTEQEDSEPESTEREAPKKRPARKRAPAKRARAAKKSPPARKKVPAMKVARTAAQQLAELTGRAPESVIGISRTDDGFVVELEVVESRRIPDSADILATYEVETDEDGDLVGYRRARRYLRGKGSDGDGR